MKRGKTLRHNITALSGANASTLKKARRLANIAAGNRPRSLVVRNLDGYLPRVMSGRAGFELHPTKGWRRA